MISKLLDKLKEKWGVDKKTLFWIMLAFSCTGTSILFIRPILFDLLNLTGQPLVLRIVLYPFVVFPVFYLFLLIYGTIFGQYTFFIRKIKDIILKTGHFAARVFDSIRK